MSSLLVFFDALFQLIYKVDKVSPASSLLPKPAVSIHIRWSTLWDALDRVDDATLEPTNHTVHGLDHTQPVTLHVHGDLIGIDVDRGKITCEVLIRIILYRWQIKLHVLHHSATLLTRLLLQS